jgi:hypothetical protein
MVLAVLATLLTIVSLAHRPVTFSFGEATCVTRPLLFPRSVASQPSPSYVAEPRTAVSLLGYPLYAHRTCVTMTAPTVAGSVESPALRARLLPFLRQPLRVTTIEPPVVLADANVSKPVSTRDPIDFRLATADRLHGYRLRVGSVTADCRKTDARTVRCYTAQLSLAHATSYDFRLERRLHGKPAGQAFAERMTTVNAITVDATSIAHGSLVYDIPTGINLTLNRRADKHDDVRLYRLSGTTRHPLPATVALSGSSLRIGFDQPLPRDAIIGVSIGSLTARDGGYLVKPYGLQFRTSGGPRVLGTSISNYKVDLSRGVALRFDTGLAAGQSFPDFIRLEAGGKVIPATIRVEGTDVSLSPLQVLPTCTAFTVRVLDGLQNSHGVSGRSAWQYASRTVCQTVFSIGLSVQGRAITAYRFGNGTNPIVMLGATHGDERSSASLLTRYVDYLEANPSVVPTRRPIIIIPVLNPDAYAANRRTNVRDVDLNRNFPADDWKSSVTMPNKSVLATGGGTEPLSEPESAAIAGFIVAQQPRLVLTYHATGGVVIPNDAGDSAALARAYADRSDVYFAGKASTVAIFEYDTTGAMEDWLHDGPGFPTLLIELKTFTGNEFAGHQNALRYITSLP